MSRLTDSLRRAAWWSSTPTGLAWLFVAGLLVRLWLARGGGFPVDMGTFGAWADKLAQEGPRRFYAEPNYFKDYPPGYMYVLLVLGKLSRGLTGGPPSVFLLKTPAILADLGLAWVVVRLAERLTPRSLGTRFPWRGAAAASILLNPAIFFVSAVWGQVDAILALLVLAGFLVLGTGPQTLRREVGGLALLVLALITKPQAAFVIPVAVVLLVWRHLRGGRAESGRRGLVAGAGRVAALGAFSFLLGLLLMAPSGLGPAEWMRFYTKAAGTYPYTSVWAFNLWGAVGFWKRDVGAGAVRILGVPALYVGMAALAAGTIVVLVRAVRALRRGELEGRVLLFGGVALTCVAFATLTRIHERYLFLAIASLAPLVAYQALRHALVLLSLLYLTNVWFPYVYYVEFAKRRAIRLGPFFDFLYGSAQDSAQKKLLSVATGVVCLVVAWRGWRWLEMRRASEPVAEPSPPLPSPDFEPAPRKRWTLELHPVGRRGAAAAGVAFLLVAVTRLAGLDSPRGMYFDEVYHARTAGEYIQGREVYEWTHPPLAKELMALSIKKLSGFGVHGRGPAPPGMGAAAASDGRRVVWASGAGVRGGRFDDGCRIRPQGRPVRIPTSPAVVAPTAKGAVVGGRAPQGPALTRVDDGREVWTAVLPSVPVTVEVLDEVSFVVTEDATLLTVAADGAVKQVATGAARLSAAKDDHVMWVTFPQSRKVLSYGTDGAERPPSAEPRGRPLAVVASPETDRVLVADEASGRIESVDTAAKSLSGLSIDGPALNLLSSIPESGMAWALSARQLRVIEPLSMSVMGRVTLASSPKALLADTDRGRFVAVLGDGLACVSGRNQFAWRFGSALGGAALGALVFLIALRLFGSMGTAWLAAAFVAFDGLAFVLSRIAMNDSYATAFLVASWFCALSCLYHRRSRWRALWWLAACGATAGFSLASKWVGLYALGGIGLLFLWDVLREGRDGIGGLAGRPVFTLGVIGILLVGLPLGIYVATYMPYFGLGHTFGELLKLQKGMYDYHAGLTASHPYGSPWYGWPAGRKAVYMYLGSRGAEQAQIWTIVNPVVFLGGLAGLIALAAAAWRRRSAALALVPFAALVQYLPWTIVRRVTFLYHYLPVVPFLALGLAWWLVIGRKGARFRNLEIAVVVAAVMAVFGFILPMIDGWFVPQSYQQTVRAWLSWVF